MPPVRLILEDRDIQDQGFKTGLFQHPFAFHVESCISIVFTCGTLVLKQGWLPPTPTHPLKSIWRFFAKLVLPRKQSLNLTVVFSKNVLICLSFSQTFHRCLAAQRAASSDCIPTHLSVCLSVGFCTLLCPYLCIWSPHQSCIVLGTKGFCTLYPPSK